MVIGVLITNALAQDTQPSVKIATQSVEWMTSLESWIHQTFPWVQQRMFGNSLWRWILFALTLMIFLALRKLIQGRLTKWLLRLTGKTKSSIDDHLLEALTPPLSKFVMTLGLYLGLCCLELPVAMCLVITMIYRITVIMIVGWALTRAVSVLTPLIQAFTARDGTPTDTYLAPMILRFVRIVIFGLIVVLILQEFGVNVAGLIAGLGVGGLAFALAARDTLANWFGAIMIYTDRPFSVGHWIKTSQLEGVVEEIGFRSTRIRTFAQTVVSIPNRIIADEVIENFSKMPKRRISFKIGVTYDTTPAMLEESIERIRDILRDHPDVDQSFWLVKFTEFGDSALEIFLYYFTDTTDWDRYLSIKQEINLRIMQRLNGIGVQFAFPSMSIYESQMDSEELSRLDAQARRLFASRTPDMIDLRESQVAPSEGNAEG
jgi:MscS family membrane protein